MEPTSSPLKIKINRSEMYSNWEDIPFGNPPNKKEKELALVKKIIINNLLIYCYFIVID